MQNLILNTDSYKTSHFVQYPQGAEYVSSYIESRGGAYPATVFWFAIIYKAVFKLPISLADIDEAEEICGAHGVPLIAPVGCIFLLHTTAFALTYRSCSRGKCGAYGQCISASG